jgi:hypothetical protein
MKVILVASCVSLSLLRLSASTSAERAQDCVAANKRAAVAVTADAGKANVWSAGGHWWYRSSGGKSYVWTPGRWVQSDGDATATTSEARTAESSAVNRTSNYPPLDAARRSPSLALSYPDSDTGDTVKGIDWYLNGRGPFSD